MRRVVGLVVLSVLVAPAAIGVLGTATPAGAAPPNVEYAVPQPTHGITAGPDGRVWFTEPTADKVGRINTDGTGLTEFPITAGSFPMQIIAGPDGNLWFRESASNKVGRIAPNGTGYVEFPVSANDLVSGPDGNIWVAGAAGITRLTPAGNPTTFSDGAGTPSHIVNNPDGALWFTDGLPGLHRVTTSGVVTTVSLPVQYGAPVKLASTPDGMIWFTTTIQALAKSTTSGTSTVVNAPITNAADMTIGSDGALWFDNYVPNPGPQNNAIIRVQPQTGLVTSLPTTPNGLNQVSLTGIASGPDGSIWYLQNTPNRIGKVPLDRTFTNVIVSTSGSPGYAGSIGLTATVTPAGSGTPTGQVTFFDQNNTVLGTKNLVNGVATLNGATLPVGSDSIHADYAGDTNFAGNTSDAVGQVVNFVPTSTSVSITPSGGYSRAGESVTLQATVSVGAGLASPAGNVHFFANGVQVGGDQPLVNATATLTTASLPQGLDDITANFVGSATHAASTSAPVQQFVDFNAQLDRYVESVYIDLLGRLPDDAGRAYWTGLLSHGVSRAATSWALVTSDEYRADVIDGMYHQFLERGTDASGLNYWVAQVGRGMTFENFQSLLMGSDEYFAMASKGNGDNDTFVKAMYKDVLGRDVDPGGEAYFVSLLQHGTPRSQVVGGIVYSYEHLSTTVDGYYEDLLGRPSDPGGNAYWTNQLQHGARDEVIVALIIGSDEYYSLVA